METIVSARVLDAVFILPAPGDPRGKSIKARIPVTCEISQDFDTGSWFERSDGEAVVRVPRYGTFKFEYASQFEGDELSCRDRWHILVYRRTAMGWEFLGHGHYTALHI